MSNTLPNRLRAARVKAGLSREQAAIAVGRSCASIVSYELDRATPTLPVLRRLADAYRVSAGELLDETVNAS